MKKMTIYFKDGESMDIDPGEINLIDNINSFYENLIIEKMNEYEYRLSGFQEEYQIFNLSTKQLYNKKEQETVVLITMDLDDIEYEHIKATIKNKENDSNN